MSALPPAFHAAHDAFGRTAALAFTASFPFLGVPLHVRSNAEAAVTLATQTFGPWASLASRLVRRDGHAHLDVIVHGDDDRLAPIAIGRELARGAPQAKLVVVEGGSHMLPVTHAPKLADEIVAAPSR